MGIKFTDFAIRGIDVSNNNGVIDWNKFTVDFSIHRVGYGRTIDDKFSINWAASKSKNNRSPYWYLDYYSNHLDNTAVNGMDDSDWGREQADTCWKNIKHSPRIVFLDIESTTGQYAPKIETVVDRFNKIAMAFLSRMDELNGRKNGVYCSLGLLKHFSLWFKDRPLWVAWYNEAQTKESVIKACKSYGWNNPIIWQISSTESIPGIGDDVDGNGWIGTNSQYESMFGTPDDEVIPVETNTTMSVKRLVSLRKAPVINQSTFITLLPTGTQLECIDKKVEGKNTWRKVTLWVAENYNGIQYLK